MLKQGVIDVLRTAALCLIIGSGCGCGHHEDSARDPVALELEEHLNSPTCGENARLALSLRKNGVIDPQPVLIAASVFYSRDRDRDVLMVLQYDEEKDIVGVGMREERQGTDRQKDVLVEEYPVFTYYSSTNVLQYRTMPIQIRRSDERKNEQQWQDFLEGKGPDQSFANAAERFWKALPPVYVSIPEPNKVDVCVYVYDRGGYKSNLVRLYHQRWKP
jgi:hypothetical protein